MKPQKWENVLCPVMKYSSVQNVFKLLITFHYIHSIKIWTNVFCEMYRSQEAKGISKQFDKSPGIKMCKNSLRVEWFKTEILGFVLYEYNETLVMDIYKMEELSQCFVFLIYLLQSLLLCLWKECMDFSDVFSITNSLGFPWLFTIVMEFCTHFVDSFIYYFQPLCYHQI